MMTLHPFDFPVSRYCDKLSDSHLLCTFSAVGVENSQLGVIFTTRCCYISWFATFFSYLLNMMPGGQLCPNLWSRTVQGRGGGVCYCSCFFPILIDFCCYCFRCGLHHSHLNVPTPKSMQLGQGEARWHKHRGVEQRNLGLSYALEHAHEFLPDANNAVIYLMDDDNTYSLELFDEVHILCHLWLSLRHLV